MTVPYGFWPSSITAENVAKGAMGYSFTEIDEDLLYWIESLPDGRSRLMSVEGELTPAPYNVRSRVHEYGGRAYAVHCGIIYFINFQDQALYRIKEEVIERITDGSIYFAEPLITEFGIIAVAEKREKIVENFLALIDPENGLVHTLASGHDFYAAPTLSSDGRLAWITWDHPNMPWDGTDLWVANFDGTLSDIIHIAGGINESIFQPNFSPAGHLYYVSDISGFWNLYREGNNALYPLDAEFGAPLWMLGMRTYGFDGEDVIASYQKDGAWSLVRIFPKGKIENINFEASYIHSFTVSRGKALFIAGFPLKSAEVIAIDLPTGCRDIIQAASTDLEFCSEGRSIEFPSKNGRFAKAYYYPPVNELFVAPENTKPPLIVKVHGGPTAQCNNSFSLAVQYWTSRGFAVVDVNYGGSAGFGRAYRDQLKSNWGIVDWEDCEAAALYLIKEGKADQEKVFIEGASAGGYTALSALTFGETFTAGASYYGISDLSLLAKETHKFESRYMDQLIGPYSEFRGVYQSRSPIWNRDRLNRPVILFQGKDDKVVPQNQAKEFYDILISRGTKVELILYAGEQHGFRKIETIINVLERELLFYRNLIKN